jgi:hypothetical protein
VEKENGNAVIYRRLTGFGQAAFFFGLPRISLAFFVDS